MARFDRKVERQKSEFSFSKKVPPKKTKWEIFKENYSFRWIKISFKTVIYMLIDFVFVSLIFIPILMQYFDSKIAFTIGHGAITSLLIVLSFYLLNKEAEKPTWPLLLIRYAFMATLLVLTSFVAVLLV